VKKHDWTEPIAGLVETAGLKRCINSLSNADHRRVAQLRSGWLPINARLSKWMVDRQEECPGPTCNDKETVDHLLRCPTYHHIWQEQWKKLDALVASNHITLSIAQAFRHGISTWRQEQEFDWTPQLGSQQLRELLSQACHEQAQIGWDAFLRGHVTTTWGEVQSLSSRSNGSHKMDSPQWFSKVHKWIFEVFFALWTERNAVLHGRDQFEQEQRKRATLAREVQILYNRRGEICDVDARRLFGRPMQEVLQESIQDLSTWVELTAYNLNAAVTRRSQVDANQTVITSYFNLR